MARCNLLCNFGAKMFDLSVQIRIEFDHHDDILENIFVDDHVTV